MMHLCRNKNAEIATSDAARIYHVLFPEEIPAPLRERFEKASQILENDYSADERAEYRRALQRVGDLEALEFACRRGKRLRMLTDQVVLMSFLAETLPQHQACYVDPDARRWKAYLAIAAGLFRTAAKYAKGTILRWKLHA
jgi:hypothetical protein